MDQDFHYYGTYYAAAKGGYGVSTYSSNRAENIAKAANFIDFLSETAYGGYWEIQNDERTALGTIRSPRYSFQAGLAGSAVSPDDGLWSSFHFLPGNFVVSNQISSVDIHGEAVAGALPGYEARNVERGDKDVGKRLTRPQSALSCAIMADSIALANDVDLVKKVLACVKNGLGVEFNLVGDEYPYYLEKFTDMVTGIRAHVVADTWAHQDWIGVPTVLNTYDSHGSITGYGIKYDDTTTGGMKKQVLRTADQYWNNNLVGAPVKVHLGHGWMGHLPDFSFVKYEYRPCWKASGGVHLRDNPLIYRSALLELTSFLSRCKNNSSMYHPFDEAGEHKLASADAVIDSGVNLKGSTLGRVHSEKKWKRLLEEDTSILTPTFIDVKLEPSDSAKLNGSLGFKEGGINPMSTTRYATLQVDHGSDLHLFQLAADYHFQFVSNWLDKNQPKMTFTGSWAVQEGAFDKKAIRKVLNGN